MQTGDAWEKAANEVAALIKEAVTAARDAGKVRLAGGQPQDWPAAEAALNQRADELVEAATARLADMVEQVRALQQ